MSRAVLDPDSFDVDELVNADVAQLASVPGLFYPAEGQARVRSDHAVDEYHPGVNFINEASALFLIICPGAGAQAKDAVICQPDGRIEIGHAEEDRYRAKQLFLVGGRILGDIRDDRGGVKVAR